MLSKGGKHYIQLDTYEGKASTEQSAPAPKAAPAPAQVVTEDEDLPF
jgi:hypothetical protein